MAAESLAALENATVMRSGKWTAEEETYASVLVLNFQRGSLDDCRNGVTLRAYLSHKLGCIPMRVSKKFAGREIGKVIICISGFIFKEW
jgi:hypothetical protein